jgi:hypothetical protein
MVDQLKGMFGGGSEDNDKKADDGDKSTGKLEGLFGGGSSTTFDEKDDDFVKRYTTGDPNEGYSEDEAKQEFQKVLKTASPDQINMAFKKTVENLPENQRAALGQMLKDRQQGKNLVQIQRTGDGTSPGGPQDGSGGLDDVLGGLLGGSGGGLGDILGGLLGGSSGGSSGGGLGDILGGLLGGSDSGNAKATPQSGATTSSASGGDSGGGIGDLLGGLLSGPQGKAIMGGIAAFAMQAMQGGKDDKR